MDRNKIKLEVKFLIFYKNIFASKNIFTPDFQTYTCKFKDSKVKRIFISQNCVSNYNGSYWFCPVLLNINIFFTFLGSKGNLSIVSLHYK